MGQQHINTELLYALNPEYEQAIARGEPWALKHAGLVESINSGEPEGMRREFDGKRRKWCGAACSHKEGCVTCTMSENTEVVQSHRQNNGYHDSAEQDVVVKPRRSRRRASGGGGSYSGDGTDDDFI